MNERGGAGGRQGGGGGVNRTGGLRIGVLEVEGFWRSATASGWKRADPVVRVGGKKLRGDQTLKLR